MEHVRQQPMQRGLVEACQTRAQSRWQPLHLCCAIWQGWGHNVWTLDKLSSPEGHSSLTGGMWLVASGRAPEAAAALPASLQIPDLSI